MKNKIAVILMLIVLSMLWGFSSCDVLSPLADYFGVMLKVDEQGHFEEEIVYQDGSVTYKFMPNGEFEYYQESYEAEGEDHDGDGVFWEEWVKVSGEKGTYSWDTDTLIITSIVNKEIVNGDWVDVANQITYTDYQYFAERNFGLAWVQGAEGWENIHITKIENTGTETWIKELIINEEIGYLKYSYNYEEQNAAGTVIDTSEIVQNGDFILYPSDFDDIDTTIKGQPFTVHATITSTTTTSFDGTQLFDEDQYIRTWDFCTGGKLVRNVGDTFFIEWPEDAAQRGLFRQ